MKIVDGFNREQIFEKIPERVVSMIPCVTETLFEFGAQDKIAGITDFCIFPEGKVDKITRIGGPKNVKMDVIDNIKPDLIFMDPEENTLADFQILEKKYPIFVVNVKNIIDSTNFIKKIGEIFENENKALKAINQILNKYKQIRSKYSESQRKKVLILLWKNPYVVPGNSTYINNLAFDCGLDNVFKDESGYFNVDNKRILNSSPDMIFLPDEPYSFSEKDEKELGDLFSNSGLFPKIKQVDGTYLCWYGIRTQKALDYFDKLVSET